MSLKKTLLLVALLLLMIGVFVGCPKASQQEGDSGVSLDNLGSNNWQVIAYGNNTYVAIADASNIAATSADGIRWTKRTLPLMIRNWVNLVFINNLFFAVASPSKTIISSPDGIKWTTHEISKGLELQAVAYGGGKYIAVVYNSNTIATSSDGTNWTTSVADSLGTYKWRYLAYNKGKFLAAAFDPGAPEPGSLITSTSSDGSTWTPSTWPSATQESPAKKWIAITYAKDKYIAISSDRTAPLTASSTDGSTWTTKTNDLPDGNWKSLAFGNNVFVTVQSNSSKARSSADGFTWIERELPASDQWRLVAYLNNKFIAVSPNREASSTDGSTWN